MAGNEIRLWTGGDRFIVGQCVDDIETRLRVLRLLQFVIGIFKTQFAHRITKKSIDILFEASKFAHLLEQSLPHSLLLRSLTWKYECQHLSTSFFERQAASRQSLARQTSTVWLT